MEAEMFPPEYPLIPISDAVRGHAQELGVCPDIHANDFVFQFVLDALWKGDAERATRNYFDLGAYSANLVKKILADLKPSRMRLNERHEFEKILDFASGYGCVARHISTVLPHFAVTTCDIHREAARFNTDVLKLHGLVSSVNPEALELPSFDVVIALSFFSHMPKHSFHRWLRRLAGSLNEEGVLIFTANGHTTHRTICPDLVPDVDGFAFRGVSEQKDLSANDYGLTVSFPYYVHTIINNIPGLRLTSFTEGLWWGTQDTYVCSRTSKITMNS
jgi:hypothetical protein